MFDRKLTREVKIGDKKIGNNNPILIQSMCNTDTNDVDKTVKQILDLEKEGCEIIRVAVKDIDTAEKIYDIKNKINIPLVCDIHFDHRIALRCMELGADKIRINPGNIGSIEKTKEVVTMAKQKNIPIRIGVNSGSVEKSIIEKYGKVTPSAIVESAMNHVKILENLDFEDIVVSIKASSVPFTLKAYKEISELINYPLHLGITESGTVKGGTIKSSVGIGSILSQGIGDTIRVSLTGDPIHEIDVAKQILSSMEIRNFGATIISCPTCGRTQINLIKIANEVEEICKKINKDIKIAVMGCVVNGPGEAKEADIGIAGGNGEGLIFKHGVIVKKVAENELLKELLLEIDKM